MKNNNLLVFTCGNPPEHRPVDFESIYSVTKLTDCYHLRLTKCYMEWNPISFAKLEYFYMKTNDYIIYKKIRYKFDDMPKLIMLLENENTMKAIERL